jgi:hypothetical protein
MVTAEKTPELWPPITNGPINCPLCNSLTGRWCAGYAGGHNERIFLTIRADLVDRVHERIHRGGIPLLFK